MAYRRSTRRKTSARTRRSSGSYRAAPRRRSSSRVRRPARRSGSARELRIVIEQPMVSPVARPDIAGLQASVHPEKPKKATF